MMQRIGAILLFYKPYALWSFGVTLFLIAFKSNLAIIYISKLFLIVFLWYFLSETTARRKLLFYKNLGISTLKLFSITYFIDVFITTFFFKLIGDFI